MKKVSRRTILSGAGLVLGSQLLSTRSWAAEFTLRLGHDVPESHSIHKRLVEAAEEVSKQTKERVSIQIFSNSQLGSSVDMLSQVRSGALDMMTVGTPLGNAVPLAGISALAFAFPNIERAWEAMDGGLGRHVREVVSKQLRIVMFDRIWDFGGFRHVTTSTKPISQPDDLKGMKIRLPVSPLYTSTFQALGASPVSMNFVEVYSALQTKIADGQENPLALINTGRFYEVQKFCSLTGHMWEPVTLVANPRAWDRVPKDAQDAIRSVMQKAALEQRKDSEQANVTLQSEMSQKGLAFNNVDRSAFQRALLSAGYYEQWKQKFGEEAWTHLKPYSEAAL
jgi:TRAP-type transport system periplasmic protein